MKRVKTVKHINAKYKLLALVPFMVFVGCKKCEKYTYPNIVKEIVTLDNKKVVLLNDANTGQERFLKIEYGHSNFAMTHSNIIFDDCDYLRPGDPMILSTSKRNNYENNVVLDCGFWGVKYDTDSIYARKERERLNQLKRQVQTTR